MIIEACIIGAGMISLFYFINRFLKKREFIWMGRIEDNFAEPLPVEEEDEEVTEEDEEFSSVRKRERAEEEEETDEEQRRREEEE